MHKKEFSQNPISHLKFSVGILCSNFLIFYPFLISAFIQVVILEILFFSSRFPLSLFFGQIIRTFYGEIYLHYPFHVYILPQLFQAAQVPIYLFIASFLIGTAIAIIAAINNERPITFVKAAKQVWQHYVHLLVASIIMFLTYKLFFSLYETVLQRAHFIRSTAGIFYLIKSLVISGAPYVNLIIGIFVSSLFAFVYPIVLISKKKMFHALLLNFKYLRTSFPVVFLLFLIPTSFYLPILLLRNYSGTLPAGELLEVKILIMIASIFLMVTIDAVVFTAITTLYLLRYEQK